MNSRFTIANDDCDLFKNPLGKSLPVNISSSTHDLSVYSDVGAPMYFTVSVASTLTFPANYQQFKGRVFHIVNQSVGLVSIPQSGSSSGAVYALTGGALNGVGGATLLAASGNWVTVVCDGSTGWLSAMSG
jgi:hypothetical protein